MAETAERTPNRVAADIARARRWSPDQDVTELYRELGFSRLKKVAREIVARDFPRPTEDQLQTVAEILRGGDAA